jgi:hypothetical protein
MFCDKTNCGHVLSQTVAQAFVVFDFSKTPYTVKYKTLDETSRKKKK